MERTFNNNHNSSGISRIIDSWWVFALSGLFSITFGCLAIYMPIDVILTMTLVFGAYLVIDGTFYLASGVVFAEKHGQWQSFIISGVLSIIFGLFIIVTPHAFSITLNNFLWTIFSFWSIVGGLSELAVARLLRREMKGEWLLALSGLLSVTLGAFMFAYVWMEPMASLELLGSVIGWYSLISGVILLMLPLKLLFVSRV